MFPPHLNIASTLPCETWSSCFCGKCPCWKSETQEMLLRLL